jgi:hypothetical protein
MARGTTMTVRLKPEVSEKLGYPPSIFGMKKTSLPWRSGCR